MLGKTQNQKITQVNANTAAGKVLRQYWQPAALSEELKRDRPVVEVNLLGERLVLFRSGSGELGLIQRHCSHRGADLLFGRLEDNGLRCPFHGWHFNTQGECTEQPAEPDSARIHPNHCLVGYPVCERNGIVFAWLGAGSPPELPHFDALIAPESHVFSFKGLWACNWLQALEVGIDPAHASFLHRFLVDEDPEQAYGKQFRDRVDGAAVAATQVLREYYRPEISVVDTDFGLQLQALRRLPDNRTHVRITNQIFPNAICIPLSREMTITQWHVPIDQHHCYWYSMFTSYTEPVDKSAMREQRMKEHTDDYRPLKNAGNNYGYDAKEQATTTYTGMGLDINVHDQWAVESMGAVQDRTREHLVTSDVAIAANRRKLLILIQALEQGDPATAITAGLPDPASLTGPMTVDTVAEGDDPVSHCSHVWQANRRACPWLENKADLTGVSG